MSVLSDKAKVKQEELWEVVGDDKYRINNLLDDKYEPRNPCDIVKDAQRLLGQELPYCVFTRNCEHFATELRYGKAESRQVRQAMQVGVGMGVGVAAVIGVGALASAIFGDPSLPPLYLHLLIAAADGALCDIPEKKSLCDPLAPALSQLYGLVRLKTIVTL
ncbi:hypothetical protein SKAU_G00369650 [Synaphobranchus kaupii]|uniref:LRAT domain-containing protein n=1 Tax=Synaphobranchus kaupii TaxID=118154 RepID=A0A9Q1EFV5_SYNKA|nr:hypothetical protein SKAU_G00369650 [Synaphobranchus kaupii]